MTSLRDWLQPRLLPCTIQTASLIGPRKENQDNYVVIAADPTGKTLGRFLSFAFPVFILVPATSWFTTETTG